MMLITSCPACSTNFHITPEQLATHGGDVRCGNCNYVFNALDRLGEATEDMPVGAEQYTDQNNAVLGLDENPKAATDSVARTKLAASRKRISFKWLPVLIILLLLMLAIAQGIYYLRTPIAAQWPALKPYLVAVCAQLNCSVELPQDIAQLAIDDSDLQENTEHQGLINLSSTLINHASFAQAYPLLELTLTDVDDQPVLRRAFSPSEYLPSGVNSANGIAPGDETHIKLTLTAGDTKATGYRVFITFP